MSKRHHLAHSIVQLARYGLSACQIITLQRVAKRLQSWHERQCGNGNGVVEWSEETRRPFWCPSAGGRFPMRDTYNPAIAKARAILANHPTLALYVQTDPRGAPLWIVPRDRVTGRSGLDCYMSGTPVCW